MADLKYYDVILAPVITEKSMNAMADKKYTFYVHTDGKSICFKYGRKRSWYNRT